MRTILQIGLAIIAGVVAISSLLLIPILGFQYTFWRMHLILDNVSEEELINRTRDLPEAKAFLEKYGNATNIWINTDYHIGVDYSVTECAWTGKTCGGQRPFLAYLEIRISLDTGYPKHSSFWCGGHSYGRAPIEDATVVQLIRDCGHGLA